MIFLLELGPICLGDHQPTRNRPRRGSRPPSVLLGLRSRRADRRKWRIT